MGGGGEGPSDGAAAGFGQGKGSAMKQCRVWENALAEERGEGE
jgi:hypothetical protein